MIKGQRDEGLHGTAALGGSLAFFYFSTERQLKEYPVFDKCQSNLVLLQTLSAESDNVISSKVTLQRSVFKPGLVVTAIRRHVV